MREAAHPESDIAGDVKDRILDAATWLGLFVVVPAHLVTVLLRHRRGDLGPGEMTHALVFVGGALGLGLLKRRSRTVRAVYVLVYILAVATLGILLYGPQVVDGMILLISLLFGVVYFRWRGLAASFTTLVVTVAAVATSTLRGWWPAPDLSLMNLAETGNDVRLGMGVLISSIVIGTFVVLLMNALDGSAERLTLAVERVSQERRGRERTQRLLDRSRQLETIGQIAGGVAHDFNNALVVILGAAQFLRRDSAAGERQKRLALIIEEAAGRASEVSRQLLTFSRGDDAGPEDVDIDAAVRHMGQVLERLLPEDVSVVVDANAEAAVFVAPGKLDQVLFRLAIQAQEALPSGGTLLLRTRTEGDRVMLEVHDDGSGEPPEAVVRIFDSSPAEGSGDRAMDLGLTLVHEIVTEAGGELACDALPGAGTTFRIALPLSELRPSSVGPPLPEHPPAGARVLVVESSDEVRSIVRRTLERAGYRVAEAADVGEARRALAQLGDVDLLCTEARLSRGDARELLAALEAGAPGTPVVICSGALADRALQEEVRRGRYTHLAKPFSADELLASIEGRLRTKHIGERREGP